MRHTFLGIGALLAALLPAAAGPCDTLPCSLDGALHGAPYRIRVPSPWNGTLLVYLMGLKSPANHPAAAPLAPPVLGGTDMEAALLARGYALAGSLVGAADLQVKEEAGDGAALAAFFAGQVAAPQRVILIGTSLGGLAALRLMEDQTRPFDAALAMCAPAAGWAENFDRRVDYLLAYSMVFGWPEEWGTLEDLRTGLDYTRDVYPRVQWPKPDGSNRGGWEFIRLIMGDGPEAFWQPDPLWGSPGLGTQMWIATHLRESVEVWATGPFTQNRDRFYRLAPEQISYLAGLGVAAEELLARMNAQTTVTANARARSYMDRYGGTTGRLQRPVVMLHTTADPQVDVRNLDVYRQRVERWGAQELLVQGYVKAAGHCGFTADQVLAGLAAVESWLETGVRPDATAFPTSLGFDPAFVPGGWPY